MRAIVKVTRAGQVSIPIEIRELLSIDTGDYVEIDVLRRVVKTDVSINEGKNQNPLEALIPVLA